MADGRPQAILSNVDLTTLKRLLTINDGQGVGDIPDLPAIPPARRAPRLHIVQTEEGPVAKMVTELVDPGGRQVEPFVPFPAPEGSDVSSVVGTWIVESHVEDGQKKDRTVGGQFIITADTMAIKSKNGGEPRPMYRYKVDAAANPRTIDMTSLQVRRGMTLEGIYKLKGDTLTMCIADSPDDDRPTEFKATKDWALFILKRHGTSR